MKKLFPKYETGIPKLARDKGFNEPCIAQYLTDKSIKEGKLYPTEITCCVNMDTDEDGYRNFDVVTNSDFGDVPQYVAAPMYQQLVDWFQEKHNIDIVVLPGMFGDGKRYHSDLYIKGIQSSNSSVSVTYAEELDKALLEAFKLI